MLRIVSRNYCKVFYNFLRVNELNSKVIYDKRGRKEATKMRGNVGQGYALNDNNRMQVVDRKSQNNCC